jgi:hypothetical protein
MLAQDFNKRLKQVTAIQLQRNSSFLSSGFNLGIETCNPETENPDIRQIFVEVVHGFSLIAKAIHF